MKRKDFLKLAGLAGASTVVGSAASTVARAASASPPTDTCVLIPTETTGPFPLDLTENTTFFRQDIRENKTGVQLNLKLKIIGADNCLPLQNVRVNIWHCDKDGAYSGYSQPNNPGQAGLTYLRGYQMTDASGIVEFVTIFPGWYTGRICHIHFQVYVSSVYAAISQLTFPIAEKNALYAANSGLYTKGADPLTFNQDNIFSDGYAYQLATLTPNAVTGGYDSYLEVTVQGSGVSGLAQLEPETGGQFKLYQNYPNPYTSYTNIPFTLAEAADVKIQVFNLQGTKVAEVVRPALGKGDHVVVLDVNELNIPSATYAYQLEVSNSAGVFRQSKLMTAIIQN
ncbi:MAG: T9SS type A sorting domain-containing protein [Saprospiraceae bacterium]|nr:T9SS type A sorting domain-containing protein [Saprospiraceae bacterium]